MRIKLLRRLCADEVKLMLERMDSNFEEEFSFQDSKWDVMLPNGKGFNQLTTIERYCIASEYLAHRIKHEKSRVYQEILSRAMSPTRTSWEYRDSQKPREPEISKEMISKLRLPQHLITPPHLRQTHGLTKQ